MATYDFGGGCACGLVRWCSCKSWSQSDGENYELFKRRIAAGETPPEGMFNPVEYRMEQKRLNIMEKKKINLVPEIKFEWFWNQDDQAEELRQSGYELGPIVAFISTVTNPLTNNDDTISIAFFVEDDAGYIEYFGWDEDYLELKKKVETEVKDRIDDGVKVIFK